MPKLSAYDKELPYSYALGIFPATECLKHAADRCMRLLVSADSAESEGVLRLREAGDVAQRIASRATFRTLRYDQAKAIVLAQRLRMHVGELAGRTDREDGHLDVETDFVGAVQVGPAGHDRHGAHFIQPLDLPCGARLGGLGSPR